jgi:hypothetical protein
LQGLCEAGVAGRLSGSHWDGIALLEIGVHPLGPCRRGVLGERDGLLLGGRISVGGVRRTGVVKERGWLADLGGMAGVSDPEPRSCFARYD